MSSFTTVVPSTFSSASSVFAHLLTQYASESATWEPQALARVLMRQERSLCLCRGLSGDSASVHCGRPRDRAVASTATTGQLLLRLGADRKLFPGSRRYLFSKSLFSTTSSKLVFTRLSSWGLEGHSLLFCRRKAQRQRDGASSGPPC